MAATRGREVASGTLWMSKNENTKIRVRTVACCGTADCAHQGQIVLYEETNTLGGSTGVADKPSRVLLFSTIAEVTSLNGNQPTFLDQPVMGVSIDGHRPFGSAPLWGMMLLLTSGEAVELYADTREQQMQWIQYLNLLAMFPYSPLPEEPRNNPIRSSLRAKLKPSNFDADSVWLVYVLAEEVGSRVHALGVHYITLRSSLVKGAPALLSIISPLDSEPIVTWEANKMRRTGSLGNLVFLEIGRRCEGGPGLIWMYACPEDMANFRETLKRFLFNGDGRPLVSKSTSPSPAQAHHQSSTMYNQGDTPSPRLSISSTASSSPSSSGESSFKLSFNNHAPKVVKSSAEYDLADLPEDNCDDIYDSAEVDALEYHYAFHTGSSKGPNRSSAILSSTPPPPVNLTSHPSRRKETHKRSSSIPNAKVITTGTTPTGMGTGLGEQQQLKGSIDSGLASTFSLEDDFQSIDDSLSLIMSELSSTCGEDEVTSTKPSTDDNNLSDLINQLESFATSTDTPTGVQRSNTLPSGNTRPPFKRAHSTSTCNPMHYMKLRNPKADLMKDGYVMMGSGGRVCLDRVPEERNSVSTPPTIPVARRTSYDQLELVKDNETSNATTAEYGNVPLPPDVAMATPVVYQREYENVSLGDKTNEFVDDEAIYMNHDQQGPTTDKEMEQLFSSAWNEIDNLQQVLNQLGGEDHAHSQ